MPEKGRDPVAELRRCMALEGQEMFFLAEVDTGCFIEPFVVDEISLENGRVFLGRKKFPIERCYKTAEEAETALLGGTE